MFWYVGLYVGALSFGQNWAEDGSKGSGFRFFVKGKFGYVSKTKYLLTTPLVNFSVMSRPDQQTP